VLKLKTLAFTGLRPHKLPWGVDESQLACLSLKVDIRKRLILLIEDENVRRFISGMAMGIDQICGEIVLELKELYPDITLTAAVPCIDQEACWQQKQRDRYARILKQCDSVHIVSETYTNECMEKRNRWMVDNCDVLLAVWDGRPGGTGNTIRYAKSNGVEIILLNP